MGKTPELEVWSDGTSDVARAAASLLLVSRSHSPADSAPGLWLLGLSCFCFIPSN